MRYRFTIKQLQEMTDDEMLRALVTERQSTVTNVYSPLAKRLADLYSKLDHKIQDQRAIDRGQP